MKQENRTKLKRDKITKSQKWKKKNVHDFLKTVSRTQVTETEVKNRFGLQMWNKLKNKKKSKIVRFLKTVSQKQKIENQTENEKEIVMCQKRKTSKQEMEKGALKWKKVSFILGGFSG